MAKAKDRPRDKCEWDLVGRVRDRVVRRYQSYAQRPHVSAYNLLIYQDLAEHYAGCSLAEFLEDPLAGSWAVTAIRRYRRGEDQLPPNV